MSFKVGDKVRCLPGYRRGAGVPGGPIYYSQAGGHGYQEGKEFIIYCITGAVLWPEGGGNGVYARACELVPQDTWEGSKLVFRFR